MIEAHIIDSRGVYLRTEQVDPMGPQPAGAVYAELPEAEGGFTRMWFGGMWQKVPDADVSPLPEPEPPVQWPRFEGNDKLDQFTMDEQLAVVTATMTDPVVKLLYDRLLGARYWTYEDPETERGLALLEAKELITAERKAQIVQQMQPR